jgi:phosphoglycerol transferase MdoB-like AlkP superfamily enzyme/glycerophosphoryl diester phosphodiesterase
MGLILTLGLKLEVLSGAIGAPDFPRQRLGLFATASAVLFGWTVVCLARRPVLTALCLNLAGSLVALADLWFWRFYGDLPSLTHAALAPQLRIVPESVVAMARVSDALLLVDLVAAAVHLAVARGLLLGVPRLPMLGVALAGLGLMLIMPVVILIRVDPDAVFTFEVERVEIVGAIGLTGFHAFDLATNVYQASRPAVSDTDLASLAGAIEDERRGAVQSRLGGAAKGLNVILISAESLQTFALDLEFAGRPLTPRLREFAAESLSFSGFYDQTHQGSTSEAEFMAMNSLLAVRSGAVATRYEANTFMSLPRVLRPLGYHTISACGEPPSFWNMKQIHAAYGFQTSWFSGDFRTADWIGAGLDDAGFLGEFAAGIRDQPTPFFAFALTSSNHHPYLMPARVPSFPNNPWTGTMVGSYLRSVRYFDGAFGQFIDALRASGLLESSMVVVYGDHRAWLPPADLKRVWQQLGHATPPSDADLWRLERRVPMMIRLPRAAHAGVRDLPGGHADIAPTIASLVGADAPRSWLGRDLTSPSAALAVFRDGSVIDDQVLVLNRPNGPTCMEAPGGGCQTATAALQRGKRLLALSDRIVRDDLAARLAALTTPAREPRRALDKVLIIAHRGNSIDFPENTLEAIDSAFDLGADVVEVDVRRSRDGALVLFHDDTLDRTTSGSGPPERLTLRELKALDAGRWKHPRFAGVRIATLQEAVAMSRGRGRLFLDLNAEGTATEVAALYRRLGIPESDAFVMTWTPAQQRDYRTYMPAARRLFEPDRQIWSEALYSQIQASALWGVDIGEVWHGSFVTGAVRRRLPVFAYTVNDEPSMRRLIEHGITGIETDRPELLLRIATSLGARDQPRPVKVPIP